MIKNIRDMVEEDTYFVCCNKTGTMFFEEMSHSPMGLTFVFTGEERHAAMFGTKEGASSFVEEILRVDPESTFKYVAKVTTVVQTTAELEMAD
jgi:hypothetical protein